MFALTNHINKGRKMTKTFTVALLSSISVSSIYANDLSAQSIYSSISKYSQNVANAAENYPNTAVYAINNIASDASEIRSNGRKLARGLALANPAEIPSTIKPKKIYMENKNTATQGIKKYIQQRDQIQATINSLINKKSNLSGFGKNIKKLDLDHEISQYEAKKKLIDAKIDILEGIENGERAYAEGKLNQFDIIRNMTINGPKAYYDNIAQPMSKYLAAAWSAADNNDYANYKKNMTMFWNDRVAIWNNNYKIDNNDAATALAFNNIKNYLTIQTIAAIQNQDFNNAVSLYANANALAYTITNLNNVQSQVQAKLNSLIAPQAQCEVALDSVRNNNSVTSARNIITNLSNEKGIEDILTNLLDHLNINSSSIYNLDYLDNDWAVNAAISSIHQASGSHGIIYIQNHHLMLRSVSSIAAPVANSISEDNIYKQVANVDGILFGDNACNFTAAQNSNDPIAKYLVTTSNQIAEKIGHGHIDPAFRKNVYVALETVIFENLDSTL